MPHIVSFIVLIGAFYDQLFGMNIKKGLVGGLFLVLVLTSSITLSLPSTPFAKRSRQKPLLRIAYWSTYAIECGIAMYTKHQVDALRRQGYTTFIYNHSLRGQDLVTRIIQDKVQVLNVQYEPKIMPPLRELLQIIEHIKARKVKVIVTVHEETSAIPILLEAVDRVIYHKKPTLINPGKKMSILPMGVPPIAGASPQRLGKGLLRKKYGFSEKDIIITTVGFMLPYKRQAELLELLVPLLKRNPHYRVQMLTSFTRRAVQECTWVHSRIEEVIKKYKLNDNVVHITSFLPQHILLERLALSDLGYLWVETDTKSTSASTKEYIAARLPVIIAQSSHFHDMNRGVIRVSGNLAQFASRIGSVITRKGLLKKAYQ